MALSPAWSLQRAIYDTLQASSALTTALGGAHIYDRAPRSQRPPYVIFLDGETTDWSTATEPGTEHLVVLNVISEMPGRKEVIAISDLVGEALHNAQLALVDHHLINLRLGSMSVRRNKHNVGSTATLRFRAVTEPN